MARSLRKLPDQIARLLIVFTLLIGGVVVIRQFVIPARLRESGFHRDTAIEKELSREVRFAGSQACIDCHDDIDGIKRDGYHRDLSCETCHGPAMLHTEDPGENMPSTPRKREECAICHTYDPSRPTGFPQINPVAHNPLRPCMTCHNPHDPKPPEVPRECTACHAEIERTKSVSPHALLECTTCHEVPEGHRITPRDFKPTKPTRREFCGECHGIGSRVVEAPKIDLETHEPKYVCWQCHYPHMPEGG